MADQNASAYQSIGPTSLLLGVPSPTDSKWWYVKVVLGSVAALLVIITVIKSFISYEPVPSRGLNIFFSVCIVTSCLSNLFLTFWSRQQQQGSSRINAIVYCNTATIICLCLCANLYQHGY